MSRKKNFSAFLDALSNALKKSIESNVSDKNWVISELTISPKTVKFRYQDTNTLDHIGRVPGTCINAIFLLVKEYSITTEFKFQAINTNEENSWKFNLISDKEKTRIVI